MSEIDRQLEDFLESYEKDEDDLFNWDLTSPEFWEKYVGISVMGF